MPIIRGSIPRSPLIHPDTGRATGDTARASAGDREATAFAGEEAAERDTGALFADLGLAVGEALLERAERPARIGVELLERRAVEVLRADVTRLEDVARLFLFLEPAKR